MRALVLVALVALTGCRTRPLDDGGVVSEDAAEIVVERLPTGLERVAIDKRDEGRDLCFTIILVRPGQDGGFGVTLPQGWAVERAMAVKDASRCARFTVPTGGLTAEGGSGSIAIDAMSCVTEIHVELRFPENGGGFPTRERLDASGVTCSR